MQVLYADQPKFSEALITGQVECHDGRSLFLVGPTPRDKATPSWRPEALRLLEEMGYDGVVLVPERGDWESLPSYEHQVKWELDGLYFCEKIVCWVPRNMATMPALTTNVEFGYWLGRTPERVLYGRPDDAEFVRYLDFMYKRTTEKDPINNLPELLEIACQPKY